jgi:3-hydroxymyristoyl/3-hydroxydecanoyl-(acyl carrier protein) dehydratase
MLSKRDEIIEKSRSGALITIEKANLTFFIPHRRSALKIDGVTYCQELENFISGFKFISHDDPDLDGHFVQKPVYPGVSLAECANLTAAMLIALTEENTAGFPTVVDFSCKCKRPVFPGDHIQISVNLLGKETIKSQIFYDFNYIIKKSVGEKFKIACEGTITGTST